jgi:hypothetical protein
MAEAAQSERLGVTAVPQRLLEHWRHHDFVGPRPFFCQIEAIETIIWLTEVAPKRAATKGLLGQIAKANEEANPVPPPVSETPDCDYAACGSMSIWSRRNWAGERWPWRSISQFSL